MRGLCRAALLLLLTACSREPAAPDASETVLQQTAAVVEPAQLEVEVRDAQDQVRAGLELTLTEVFHGAVYRSRSDQQGLARFVALPPGSYELALTPSAEELRAWQQSSGRAAQQRAAYAPRLPLELKSGLNPRVVLGGPHPSSTHVRGTVRRQGSAVPGVLVSARALDQSSAESWLGLSDAQGNFELHLVPGQYEFTLQHSLGGASTARRATILAQSKQSLELDLAGGLLRGRLLNREREALSGLQVELQLLESAGLPAVQRVQPQLVSDERGEFLFRDLPAGIYELRAGVLANPTDQEAQRYARVLTRELKLPLEDGQDLELVLAPGKSVRGVVEGGDTGARVYVHDAQGRVLASVLCERSALTPAGRVEFRVDDLPIGPLRLRAEYRSLGSPLSEELRLDLPEMPWVELRLEPSCMLRVAVRPAAGAALARVVALELRSQDQQRVEQLVLRAIEAAPASLDGYFNALGPGRYTLFARDEQGRRAQAECLIDQPGSQLLNLVLE